MAVIYQIRNRESGALYIGKTSNSPAARWQAHLALFATGRHTRGFQQDWDTYGPDAFILEVVLTVLPGADPYQLEQLVYDGRQAAGFALYNATRPLGTGTPGETDPLYIRVPPATKAALVAEAARQGRPLGNLAAHILTTWAQQQTTEVMGAN